MLRKSYDWNSDYKSRKSILCINGKKKALHDGRYTWIAPIGYENVNKEGKATIEINKISSKIVKKAFIMFSLKLFSVNEILEQIRKDGLVNRYGKTISKTTLLNILKNEIYIGRVSKFGVIYKLSHTSIVSEEIFNQVQQIFRQNNNLNISYLNEKHDFPLRRFVKNKKGQLLTGSWCDGGYLKYAYYRFGMNGINYDKDELEILFKKYLDSFALQDETFAKLKEDLFKNINSNNISKVINQLNNYIAELIDLEQLLIDRNKKYLISSLLLRHQCEQIEKELSSIRIAITRINYSINNFEFHIQKCKPCLIHPSILWSRFNFISKLKLQWFLFPSGLIFNGINFGTKETCKLFISNKNNLDIHSSVEKSLQLIWRNPEQFKTHNSSDKTILYSKITSEIVELSHILRAV